MRNNIKVLRKAARLRQEDMAKVLGVTRQTIIAIENNKYNPTLELAMKIARLLCKPLEDIFFWIDKLMKYKSCSKPPFATFLRRSSRYLHKGGGNV